MLIIKMGKLFTGGSSTMEYIFRLSVYEGHGLRDATERSAIGL
jgi:hypothetical protein